MHKASYLQTAALTMLMTVNSELTALAGHHNVHKSNPKATSSTVQKAPYGNYTYYNKYGEK